MSLEPAVAARLLAAPDVTSIAGQRIGWLQRLATPCVSLTIVSDPRPQHYRGFQRVRQTDIQADCWADNPGAAAALREAVIAALVPAATRNGVTFQRGRVENIRHGAEREPAGSAGRPDAVLYRESIDFILTHNA